MSVQYASAEMKVPTAGSECEHSLVSDVLNACCDSRHLSSEVPMMDEELLEVCCC